MNTWNIWNEATAGATGEAYRTSEAPTVFELIDPDNPASSAEVEFLGLDESEGGQPRARFRLPSGEVVDLEAETLEPRP